MNDRYADEARELWGGTAAYEECARRTARYTGADWEAAKAAMAEALEGVARAMDAGLPPDAEGTRTATAAYHAVLERYFYACPPAVFCSLADGYLADDRFRETFEAVRPGLTGYLARAMHALAGGPAA